MRNRQIFKRILYVIVGMLLPIMILFAYANEASISVVEKEIKSSSQHKLGFLLSQLDAQIYQLNANMLTIVRDVEALEYATRFEEDPYERSMLRSDLENKLLLVSITSPWSNRIAMYAPQLDVVVSSDGKEAFDRRLAYNDKAATWSFSGQADRPSTWTFTRHMADTAFAAGGANFSNMIVETGFSALNLQNMLDQYKAGSSGDPFFWLPGEGVIIDNRTADSERTADVARLFRQSEKKERGSLELQLSGGAKVLATYLHVEQLDGYLIDYVPLHESLAPIDQNRNLFYLTSALLLITASLAAYLLYRHVQVPIRRLVDGVQSIKLGRFDTRIHDKASSEFEYLYNRFNQMAAQIQQLIENVYEEKIRAKDAKLKQLQSQINPHFLYNCFSHIIHMSDMGHNEGVSAMSHNLCDYYRYTTRVDKPTASLAEELGLVRNYLDIQQVRIPRLRYTIDIPDAAEAYPVPRLLLQPLVENAVVHGIEPYSKPDEIRISGEFGHDRLTLTIRDNGPGMPEERLAELVERIGRAAADEPGHGLANVHQRLQLAFGPESGLRLENAAEGGLQVTVTISRKIGTEGQTI